MRAATHPDNAARLALLRRYGILDTPREQEFDEVVELVSELLDMPIALISLVEDERQWFKAAVGFGESETPIESAICAHAILADGLLEIGDTTQDPRTADNPLVTADGGVRFYAGQVLTGVDGMPLGTLCVLDTKPRSLSARDRKVLKVFAHQIMRQLDLRLGLQQQDLLRREIDHRVKNSLASVSALVGLQASRTKSDEVRAALADVRQRLAATIALHDELHQAGEGLAVSVPDFLARVARELQSLLPEGVRLDRDLAPLELTAEGASSVGLVVNEFVSNAGKYAFRGGARGAIAITGRREGDEYVLTCRDDGAADQATLEASRTGSGLGMRIIKVAAAALAAQVDWSLAEPGLRLELRFPYPGA